LQEQEEMKVGSKRKFAMRIRELTKGFILVTVSIVWAYSVLQHISTVMA
jgi:hypothetical protein